MNKEIINEEKAKEILENTKTPSKKAVLDVLEKAKEKKGLELNEIGYLVNIKDKEIEQALFETAHRIKFEIYGERIVLFAPLYVSDYCVNDCKYCNFHRMNKDYARNKLTLEDVEEQVKILLDMGHKRLLLEFGEDPVNNPIDYVVKVIEKIYSVKTDKGNIRRLNVNIAATTVEDYKKLKSAKIGTYQLFQETFHKETYKKLHNGPKADYDRQITAHERAFKAGIDDVGIGVLFGLYDWKFEILSLISYAQYLNNNFGVGPHTISIPRFRPAPTVIFNPGYPVSDGDFLKIIAIIRLAVPYTGMIISTREPPEIRSFAFKIGISQASAASVTVVGGYGKKSVDSQFEISDHRSLAEVIGTLIEDKYIPSFCTACYRSGRTGEAFMDLAKPGEIHNLCRPNALITFAEYLEDFAEDGIYEKGHGLISYYLEKIKNDAMRNQVMKRLAEIKKGKRDLYF